jgi:hypothetical protein
MMTLDSAWRQYKGTARDLGRIAEKFDQARNVWERTLLEQMMERLEEAKEIGLDVTDTKTLLRIGVPCTSCLTIVTAATKRRHKVYAGGAESPAVYAECDSRPLSPDDIAMPTWPDMPTAGVPA